MICPEGDRTCNIQNHNDIFAVALTELEAAYENYKLNLKCVARTEKRNCSQNLFKRPLFNPLKPGGTVPCDVILKILRFYHTEHLYGSYHSQNRPSLLP
jgi:hypothetical protein